MNELDKLSDDELVALYREKKNVAAAAEAMQMALKIALNSLYGAQANQYFRYYSTDIAEGITLTGQLTIRYISKELNALLNKKLKTEGVDYVIANDTDSAYIHLDELVRKVVPADTPTQKVVDFVDKFVSTVIEPFIAEKYSALADYVNAYENKMHMKREAIADRGIWRAKKNYILQVYDNEGVRYTSPTFKAVGIEVARSSTPETVRDALEDCLIILLNGSEEELQAKVKTFKEQFMSAPVEDIAFPRGVSDIDKWSETRGTVLWKSGAPIHVKASIAYNATLRKLGLHKKFPPIKNGDKIKFVYLRQPNPVHNNAIAFTDFLHRELQLETYVDRELQFEKAFLEPLRSFTTIVRWETEKVNNIADFFCGGDVERSVQVSQVTAQAARTDSVSNSKSARKDLTSAPKPRKIQPKKVSLDTFLE